MKLKWQQAPVKTQWGDDMVVASVAIDNDHTLSLYCERDQTPKVDAMFAQRKPLTDEQANDIMEKESWGPDAITLNHQLLRTIRRTEAAHSIKENT